MATRTILLAGALIAATAFVAAAAATQAQRAVFEQHMTAAKAANPAFAGFSAERGRAFFQAKHTGGRAETPSCTSCHTADPAKAGRTRAGKEIAPMTGSTTRFADTANVEKWFKRCTPHLRLWPLH